ncbi:MAG: hypothetical protein KDA78_10885 [Planctomycetaceae bacterium]|nr:hypothetical protein [Planctomycetaceae bacterium]
MFIPLKQRRIERPNSHPGRLSSNGWGKRFCLIACWLMFGLTLPATGLSQLTSPFGAASPMPPDPPARVTYDSIQPWLTEIPLKTARPGIQPEEGELYYRLLAFVRDADPVEIQKAADRFLKERHEKSKSKNRPLKDFPVFVDLYQHPEDYQGRPVTMRGHVQRAVVSKAGKNEDGVEQLCELWLFTDDSQTNPTVVMSTKLPPGFPVGEQTTDQVSVTGYVYRLYTYEARDTGRFAPLLMASSIQWTPAAKRESGGVGWGLLILGTAAMLFVSLIIASIFHENWMNQREQERRSLNGELKDPAQVMEQLQEPEKSRDKG